MNSITNGTKPNTMGGWLSTAAAVWLVPVLFLLALPAAISRIRNQSRHPRSRFCELPQIGTTVLLCAGLLWLGSNLQSFGQTTPFRLTIRKAGGTPQVTVNGPTGTPALLLRSAEVPGPLAFWELVDAKTLTNTPHVYLDRDYPPLWSSVFYLGVEAPAPGPVSARPVSVAGIPAVEVMWGLPPLSAAYYALERADGGSQNFTELAIIDDPEETSYFDEDICAGATNRYRLKAAYSVVSEVLSRPSQAATVQVPIAAPTGLSVRRQANGTLLLGWTLPPMPVEKFIVERSINNGAFEEILSSPAVDVTSLIDDDEAVKAGATYCYRLRSSACGESTNSSSACITLPLDPPSNVAATWLADCTLRVQWTAPSMPVEKYIVERSINDGSFIELPDGPTGTETFFIDMTDQVQAGAKFCYRLKSWTRRATSTASVPGCATVALAPPSNVAATWLTTCAVRVQWTPSVCAQVYIVERSVNGGPYVELEQRPGGTDTSLVDTDDGVAAGATFCYRLKSKTDHAISPASAPGCLTVPLDPPGNVAVVRLPNCDPETPSPILQVQWTPLPMCVKEYVVERSVNGGSFVELDERPAGTASFLNDSDAGVVAAGATYCYRLRSVSDIATSAASSSACLTVPLDPPGNVAVVLSPDCKVQVRWTVPAVCVQAFVIERSSNGGAFSALPEPASGMETTFNDTEAVAGARYCYQLRSRTINGLSGLSSSACLDYALNAPSGVTATANGATSVTVRWASAGPCVEGYKVYRNVCAGAWEEVDDVVVGMTESKDTDLTSGSVATYLVRSYTTSDGVTRESADSNTANATTTVPPPKDLTIDNNTLGKVVLNWTDDTENEAGFIIFRAVGGAGLSQYSVVGADVDTFTDTSVSVGAVIRYQVRAYVVCGPWHSWSDPSAEVSILATPVLRSPANDPGYGTALSCPIKLDWDPVAGAAQYKVQVWYINSATGAETLVVNKEVTASDYTPSCGSSGEIRLGRRHKWQIRAISPGGGISNSSASTLRYFRT